MGSHGRSRAKTRRQKCPGGGVAQSALVPRIVVLDNDETTGSYGPLFDLLGLLKEREVELRATGLRLRDLVPRLVTFCYKAGLFRPGLRDLLLTLSALREKHLLDAVVMYTYQSEASVGSADALHDAAGQLISVPVLLDYMFGYIAGGCRKGAPLTKFFDVRIVRETHMKELGCRESALGAKKISLVFDQLQRQPSADLRGFVFIDDCIPNVRMPGRVGGEEVKVSAVTSMSVVPFEFETAFVPSLGESYLSLWNTLLRGLVGREEFGDFMNKSIQECLEAVLPESCTGARGAGREAYQQIDFAPLARRLKGHFVGLA